MRGSAKATMRARKTSAIAVRNKAIPSDVVMAARTASSSSLRRASTITVAIVIGTLPEARSATMRHSILRLMPWTMLPPLLVAAA